MDWCNTPHLFRLTEVYDYEIIERFAVEDTIDFAIAIWILSKAFLNYAKGIRILKKTNPKG